MGIRVTKPLVGFLAVTCVTVLLALAGCGGSAPGSLGPDVTTPQEPTVDELAMGDISVDVLWPGSADDAGARFISTSSKSILVEVLDDTVVVGQGLITRPASTLSLTDLPAKELVVRATAYPNADGTGTAQSTGQTSVTVVASSTRSARFTLATTVSSIVMTPSTVTVGQYLTTTLTASAVDSSGATVLTAGSWTWRSNATGVATVGADGAVTGVKAGAAIISATEDELGLSGTASVTVTQAPAGALVTPLSSTIQPCGTATLTARLIDDDGNEITAGVAWTWSSSSAGVATVDNDGLVTGVAAGTTTITARETGTNESATATVTVVRSVADVALSATSVAVGVTGTVQLAATATDNCGAQISSGVSWTWSSSDTSVATVGTTGIVTGVAEGTATITVTETGSGLSDTASVSVTLLAQLQNPKDATMLLNLIPSSGTTAIFGSADSSYGQEKPQFSATLPTYYLAESATTNAQYAKFLNDAAPSAAQEAAWLDLGSAFGSISKPSSTYVVAAGRGDHPVVEVTHAGAVAYCDWAGLRLPSELEWEMGARGTDGREYPWGGTSFLDQYDNTKLRNFVNSPVGPPAGTCEVTDYPTGDSPFGLHNMVGNVNEWCADWYSSDIYVQYASGDLSPPATGTVRAVRGSGWDDGSNIVSRCTWRASMAPTEQDEATGFRCAFTP